MSKMLLCLVLQPHQQLRYSQADLQTYITVLDQLEYGCELALSCITGWLASFGQPFSKHTDLACSHSCFLLMHVLI